MKLGWDLRTGLKRRLTAWKNWDDPCPGNFTYGIEFRPQLHTFPDVYIRRGDTKFYRTGSWTGISFSGSPSLRSSVFFDSGFVYNDDEVYFSYNLKNKSVITRMVMNGTDFTNQQLAWFEPERSWQVYSTVPRDQCDVYDFCGVNTNCNISESPACQCLRGFKPKYPEKWNIEGYSDGCVRDNTQSCEHKNKDVFVKFSGLKLPDSSLSWLAGQLNLEECEAICLNNCTCMAYANSDVRGNGSGCVVWFGDLMDIRILHNDRQNLFIRVSNSESGRDDSGVRAVIVGAVIGGVSVILLLGYCICRSGSKGRTSEATTKDTAKEKDFELPLFSLAAISGATDNFAVYNKLGEGGFGPVYKGKLEDGQEIAVKRLSLSSRQGINEFKNEVLLIAKLQHQNLVKLLGCCIQGEEKLLIYEYMPNKSLDFFIFDEGQSKLLEWPKRFEILCGVARGLQYLHQDSRLRIVHRDLKASNILLDNKMNPKISDFGMAKTFGGDQTEGNTNRIAGTHGYMAPEYAFNGLFSTKSDVFSFGIMVLEIISGKRSIRFHHENHNITTGMEIAKRRKAIRTD
ncbi:hypothetical protein TIFTF001_043248 [Ficus carica]|uniref:non-specific serine/threonine protein kinase n=1 Tax=Ficus carica TaxID=3494 RepID=A0AA88CLN7_FICCA|nr:hypothetical protein TIFTF001_043247 [Ficus carica]GMN21172.1 hypothetical protein TIFTF001_043248 [Ficus carica]